MLVNQLDIGEIRKAISDPETSAFVLLTIALSTFGDGVFGDEELGVEQMDSTEIWAGLREAYGSWISEEGENRLNAIITGLEGGRFWLDLDVFMAVSTALMDGDLGDMITLGFEDLGLTEIMWAILEMELAWQSDERPEFSRPVREYIEKRMKEESQLSDAALQEIREEYIDLLEHLRALGIPTAALRELDAEYAEVVDALESGTVPVEM